jgi:hypothetical protein
MARVHRPGRHGTSRYNYSKNTGSNGAAIIHVNNKTVLQRSIENVAGIVEFVRYPIPVASRELARSLKRF